MYSTAFHKAIESDELPQAVRVADYIQKYIKPSVFYDFGCSTGLYLREVKKRLPTIESRGFEFSKDAVAVALCPDVIETDLTLPLSLEKQPNTLGLCLEVLEHIEDTHWKEVLTNLTKTCNTLIFSAALPGQGGTGHINCRPRIDWIRRFHELGWVVDADATQHLLTFIKQGCHMGWFAANAMVLVPAGTAAPVYYFKYY
jgi:hypothetical protein